jgi:FkbM family methyltransferase
MNRKTATEVFAGVLLFGAIGTYHEPMIGIALFAAGRGAGCTWEGAARAIGNSRLDAATKGELKAGSRRIARDGELEEWETARGKFWIPAGSFEALLQDLAEQDRDIYTTRQVGVRPGDVVLDCGANIGLYTRTALAAGASQVVAIEPSPRNLECLRRNHAAAIAAGHVLVLPKGVWDKDDILPMHRDPDNAAADTFVPEMAGKGDVINLPLTTIDKIAAELGLPRVDFIKMDIEGAERNALRGAASVIARHHPRMAISAYHRRDDVTVIPATIRGISPGYRSDCTQCIVGELRIQPTVFMFF